MRWILGLGLLIAIVYWVQHRVPEPTYTGIPNYNEVRIAMKIGPREIEMVSYLERDASEPCQESDRWFVEAALNCEALGQCAVKQRSCMTGLPNRYHPIFDQQPDTTAYLHVDVPEKRRKGVLLLWGLTESESIQVCQAVLAQVLASQRSQAALAGMTARCINPG